MDKQTVEKVFTDSIEEQRAALAGLHTLMTELERKPGEITIQEYANENGLTRESAHTELKHLEKMGKVKWVGMRKIGRCIARCFVVI